MRWLVVLLFACGSDPVDDADDPQLPPRGDELLAPWLAAEHYKTWRCEVGIHQAMPPSPHPSASICSNDKIYEKEDGEHAVGAATVKELYEGGERIGHAVSRKLGSGDQWYWYEEQRGEVFGDGHIKRCLDCHASAPRDFVWTQVP